MNSYRISYLYISQTHNIGWIPKTKEVVGERNLKLEIERLTTGVINGNKIIQKIEKV